MGKIFCIMGKSSSGKDTIFRLLSEENNYGLKEVIGYTTRPKRKNETDGIEYYFVNEEKLSEWEQAKKVIETRCYDTIYGKWYYSTIDDGQIDILSSENYITISTLESFMSMKQYYGKKNVLPIYIDIDNGLRLQRALDREKEQLNPRYEELCRRFLADSKDFSNENLKKAEILKSFENYNLDIVLNEIKKYIEKNIE
ncbi:MAG: guanylate kinase [Sarcina sp.]